MNGQLFHLQIDGQMEGGRNREQTDVQMMDNYFIYKFDGQMEGKEQKIN